VEEKYNIKVKDIYIHAVKKEGELKPAGQETIGNKLTLNFYCVYFTSVPYPTGLSYSVYGLLMLTYNTRASIEGISGIARSAGTCRIMVNDLATGLNAASAWTRIYALLILTVEVLSAIRANNTLGATVGGGANVGSLTRAHGMVVNLAALTIWTAG